MKFLNITLLTFSLAVLLWSVKKTEAKNIRTNEVYMVNAPQWLTQRQVEKATDKVQDYLEHQTKRVQVRYVPNQKDFEAIHKMGPLVRALTRRTTIQVIFLGPQVTKENFKQIFGHELAHVIVAQKYKGAIPPWLEEGLANFAGGRKKINYAWLAERPIKDIRILVHPFSNQDDRHLSTREKVQYHYTASMALMDLLKKKCDIHNLLQMSVKKSVEDYLKTYCEIPDLSAAFNKWVAKKAKYAAVK